MPTKESEVLGVIAAPSSQPSIALLPGSSGMKIIRTVPLIRLLIASLALAVDAVA